MTLNDPILVVSATGKTGRRVLSRLHDLGVPTRSGSRSADPPFDWTDRSTWAPVLDGACAAYVAYHPDLALPGAAELLGAFAAQAVQAGCRRLVLLSGRGEVAAEEAERAFAASGADWTVLRCSWFMQNFSEGMFAPSIAAGELALPAGERAAPFVDVDDVAKVAAAVLTRPGHEHRTYDLTGPEALSHRDVARILSEVTGRPVGYRPISIDAFAEALRGDGVPDEVIALLLHLFDAVLTEDNAHLGEGVAQVLGRRPTDFRTFAHQADRTAAWAVPTAG